MTTDTRFKTVAPSPLLKFALTLDAAVSGATAALQLAAPDTLSQTLLLPRALLVETGVFFVAYVALLAVMARCPRLWSALVGVVVVGNAGWALGCVVFLVSGLLSPNLLGITYVAVQAAAVLLFAVLQFKGLKASPQISGAFAARS